MRVLIINRDNAIYFITALVAFGVFVTAVFSLTYTVAPSAEIRHASGKSIVRFEVAQFKAGSAHMFLFENKPYVIWHRDAKDIALAREQDNPDHWRYPTSKISGRGKNVAATDVNLTLNNEWFFASPVNSGGIGCIVLIRYGDFGGFFDPCRGDHFDLSGRLRSGIATENLMVVKGHLSEDGTYITLDLDGIPEVSS